MKQINVYFNRCFTDTSEVIKELINNEDNVEYRIFISHPVKNEKLQAAADFYELEPDIKEINEYKNYCINFCIEHNINIFVPRYRVEELVSFKEEFENNNIKVLFVGNADTYNRLNDKGYVYKKYEHSEFIKIPPFKVITNYSQFNEAYEYIKTSGFSVCIKPVKGIGAEGFKVIKEDPSPMEEFYFSSYKISKNHLENLLQKSCEFEPLMLSGMLPDGELSVDCLADNGILIDAVTRIKTSRFCQEVKVDEHLNEMIKKIVYDFKLDNLFNVQFRIKNNDMYLLEVNTRMSAGIFKSCKIGINFLHKVIMKNYGIKIKSEMESLKTINVITAENTTVLKNKE